jgi:hypothetical protein
MALALRRATLLSFALMVLGLTSCSAAYVVSGEITKGGSPHTPAAGEKYVVILQTTDGKGQYNGDVGPDGKFQVLGPNGKGVPPGKYHVQVMVYTEKIEMVKSKSAKGTLISKPPTPKSYPDAVDVSSAPVTLSIDISKLK